jgi:periodic tryptophan protein 1
MCLKVSLENGLVLNFDIRTLPSNLDLPAPARFTLSAHDGAASSIDVNPNIKGCIATGGIDKLVKVWNVTEDDAAGKHKVSLVTSRDLGVVRFSLFLRHGNLNVAVGQSLFGIFFAG